MRILVDGDIITYRAGFACENEDLAICLWQADQMIESIIKETGASECSVFLTGSDNFRYSINPEYKANRHDAKRPKWLQQLREHLVVEWKASISNGIEADDAMGIHQCEAEEARNGCAFALYPCEQTTIATIDKDLLMIPGLHYNFVKKEHKEVTEVEGMQWFYYQLIMGDKADNIEGYDGKMRVACPKFLIDKVETLYSYTEYIDMYNHVAGMWEEARGDNWKEPFMTAAHCLWIWRKENDKYVIPT